MDIQKLSDEEVLNELTRRMKNMNWIEKTELSHKIGILLVEGAKN